MRRSLLRLAIPLREPFVTAGGVVSARELAVIRLEDDDGTPGIRRGRAAGALRRRERGRGGRRAARGAARARRAASGPGGLGAGGAGPADAPGGPAARRAVGRRDPREPDPAGRARRTRWRPPPSAGVRDGYSCFKVKVGLPDDARARGRGARGGGPVARAAGGRQRRVGGRRGRDGHLRRWPSTTSSWWSSRARTLEEMAEVRARVEVPLAADEPIAGAADVRRGDRARAHATR